MAQDTIDCEHVLSALPPEIIQRMRREQKMMHEDYSTSIDSQEQTEAHQCL